MHDLVGLSDFDRYVQEHGMPPEHHPAAFAQWIAEVTALSGCRLRQNGTLATRFLISERL